MGLFSNLSFRKRNQPTEPGGRAEPTAEEAVAYAAGPELAAMEVGPAPPVAPNAADCAQAEELVRRVTHELPSFITVAVVEAATGSILAGQWAGHSGGLVEVALANAELVRQTNLAIEALQLAATEQLADVLITLRHQLHLLRVLPQADWLLYLAVHTQNTNPVLARAALYAVDN